jgi:hypothetical protein
MLGTIENFTHVLCNLMGLDVGTLWVGFCLLGTVINLRKAQVRRRYGDASDRTIERMVDACRIPKPDYFGNTIPYWNEAKLERNDRTLAAQSSHVRDQFQRLMAEVTAATTAAEARGILHVAQLNGKLEGLTEAQVEGLQDAVSEKS